MSHASITELNQRLDRIADRLAPLPSRMDKAKNCVKGISCGSTCIPKGKTCKAKAGPAAAKLAQLVKAEPSAAPAATAATGKAAPKQSSKAPAAKAPAKAPAKAAAAAPVTPPAKAASKAPAGLKVPSAKQIAAQEARVEAWKAKWKGPGGSKHLDAYLDAKIKLADMKELAADPAGYARKKEAAAKEEAQRKERQQAWEQTQGKLDERQNSARSKLKPRDLKALTDYTADGGDRPFQDVNECARQKPCKNKRASSHIKELDAALAKLPANDDGDLFYRGLGVTPGSAAEKLYQALEKAKPGTTIQDPGFASYSSREQVAETFMTGERNIKFVSRNKALRPINTFSEFEDEYEALLPRDTSSTIRSVTKRGDTLIVELD